ncbi:M48 family peptidase, partial [Citrobacter sp. AAK_AS5]
LEALPGSFPSGFALGSALALFFFLLDLPWEFYGTFRVESRFGFNRSPLPLFLRDSLLQAGRSLVLSGVLAGSASLVLGLP